jgi:hypothetical protein
MLALHDAAAPQWWLARRFPVSSIDTILVGVQYMNYLFAVRVTTHPGEIVVACLMTEEK